ncbi:hypothetical protein LINPERPRIM_LOCUS29022 [Linum perenne]
MIREANKTPAKEDKREKARIEARNCLEEYISELLAYSKRTYCCCSRVTDPKKIRTIKAASEWLKKNKGASKDDFEMKKQKLTKAWHTY